MSNQTNNSEDQFDENGSKPTDVIDGWAITAIIAITVTAICYYLHTI